MSNSRNGSLSKIILYKKPILDKIIRIVTSFAFTSLPVVGLILDFGRTLEVVLVLICMLGCCFLVYLDVFRSYACLELNTNKLVISNGLKREEFPMEDLLGLQVVEYHELERCLVLKIDFIGYSKEDGGWSYLHHYRTFIGSLDAQKKRMETFCEQCNQYLAQRNAEAGQEEQ